MRHEISNNVVCATSKAPNQPAHTRSLIRAFANRSNIIVTVKLLTKQHLEFLSLKGSCAGSSEVTLVKMPHCWKSHVAAHMCSFEMRLETYPNGHVNKCIFPEIKHELQCGNAKTHILNVEADLFNGTRDQPLLSNKV